MMLISRIFTSSSQYPHFDHLLNFQNILFVGMYSKYFSNWSDVRNFPDLNVLERVLIAVKFLSTNIEKQKSYPRFPKKTLTLASVNVTSEGL